MIEFEKCEGNGFRVTLRLKFIRKRVQRYMNPETFLIEPNRLCYYAIAFMWRRAKYADRAKLYTYSAWIGV